MEYKDEESGELRYWLPISQEPREILQECARLLGVVLRGLSVAADHTQDEPEESTDVRNEEKAG